MHEQGKNSKVQVQDTWIKLNTIFKLRKQKTLETQSYINQQQKNQNEYEQQQNTNTIKKAKNNKAVGETIAKKVKRKKIYCIQTDQPNESAIKTSFEDYS